LYHGGKKEPTLILVAQSVGTSSKACWTRRLVASTGSPTPGTNWSRHR